MTLILRRAVMSVMLSGFVCTDLTVNRNKEDTML